MSTIRFQHTRVLVALKHKLSLARSRVPELDTTVLATRHDPLAIGGESDTENKVLVALEGLDALAALGLDAGTVVEASVVELPHLDGLVERAGDEVAAIRREGHTVDTVLVALLAFGALNEYTSLSVPDADALVQTTCGDKAVVGWDGNGGDAIFNLESKDALILLDIPESDCAVAGAGGDVTTVGGEVERVNILFVAGELVENALAGNIPDLRSC
jgi:hypothetical protein